VSLVLTGAGAGPSIGSVQDAESGQITLAPGQWAAIYGSGLSATSRVWTAADFGNGGATLPTALDGVSVQFGLLKAPVLYISPGQIDVQVPAGAYGSMPVTVTNNGVVSAAFSALVVQNSPSLFVYPAGTALYPAAIHTDGTLIGDPSVQPGATPAHAAETIVLYVNGLGPSPSGYLIPGLPYSSPVTVSVGGANVTVSYAGLVAAGQYQLNVTLPGGLKAGNYPITVSSGGQTSPGNVILPVR
jgi:uncharacterized protein (TIGR03437 family)